MWLQIVYVTTQVTTSRRVLLFKLQLRGRLETRRSTGGGGGGGQTHTDGVVMELGCLVFLAE